MNRLLVPLVLALLAACQCPPDVEHFDADSCRGRLNAKYVELRWRAGRDQTTFDGPGGGLDLDVRRVANLLVRHGVEVEVWFTNRYDREVRFDTADVRLAWDGDELPCSRASAKAPAVRPGRPVRLTFGFDVDTGGRSGVHDLIVLGAHFADDAGDRLSGGPLVVPVKVPGRIGTQDDAASGDTQPMRGERWRDDR
ncbi:MAG: hypothetical protein H6825_07310 [Planctomycetes bacterium]|nr:hypothetical protein [Planctomycetota bacterium]